MFINKTIIYIISILVGCILSFSLGIHWRWDAYQTYDYTEGNITYTQIYPKEWPTYALFGGECIAIMECVKLGDDEKAKNRIKAICLRVLKHIELRYPIEDANGKRQLERLKQAIEEKIFNSGISTKIENNETVH